MITMAENRLCVPWLLAGLLVLSALLHFAWFTYPMTVVLDEVHYGRFAMAAMRHEFFFDIHPPLGKLLYWSTGESPEPNTLILCAAYALNLLPFVGIARVMFLYHYLSALMFAVLALCWQLDRAQRYRGLMPALLAAAIMAFIFFAPFTYGLHLSKSGLDAHFWLDSWR